MISRNVVIWVVGGVVILAIGSVLATKLFIHPVRNMDLGEITNGQLAREFTMPSPRGNFVFFFASAGDQQPPLKGTLDLYDENERVIAFRFSGVRRDYGPDFATNEFGYCQLQRDGSTNGRIEIKPLENKSVRLKIKLDEPNDKPIRLMLHWPE